MLYSIFCLVTFFAFIIGCPDDATVPPPCKCTKIGYHTSYVTCSGAYFVKELQESIRSLEGTPIRYLEIVNSSLNYLPHSLFKGVSFEKLLLNNNTFVSLTETEDAFEDLEEALKLLKVQECILLSGWQWGQLAKLKSLTEIHTVKTGLEAIDDDIAAIAHLEKLENLLLTQDSISYIQNYAFAPFKNLRVLSLKRNMITDVTRSMFPNPASNLVQVILSYNKLSNLPADLFTHMPNLKTVAVSDNELLTIREETMRPVWSQLNKIDLTDNPLRCDCRMQWLLSVKAPANIWVECAEPPALKRKNIKDLQPNDLTC